MGLILPIKSNYTFDELVKRWERYGCTIDLIKDYVSTGRLSVTFTSGSRYNIYTQEIEHIDNEPSISGEEVLRFEAEYLTTPATTEQATVTATESQTPEEFVLSLRKKHETDEVIAALTRINYPGLTAYEGMKLLDPIRVEKWESDNNDPDKVASGRPKNWFTYRAEKGDIILADRENVTMSQ